MRRKGPSRLEQLVVQSATFPRSRRELVRHIREHHQKVLPSLFRLARRDLGSLGQVISAAIRNAVLQPPNDVLLKDAYILLPKKSIHFIHLAVDLCVALTVLVRRRSPQSHHVIAPLLHNLAEHLIDAQQIPKALEASQSAVREWRIALSGHPDAQARLLESLLQLASLHSLLGDHRKAIRISKQVLSHTEANTNLSRSRIGAAALTGLGLVLARAERPDQAIEPLKQGFLLFRKLGNKTPNEIAEFANSTFSMADVFFDLGAVQDAYAPARIAQRCLEQLAADSPGAFLGLHFAATACCARIYSKLGVNNRAVAMEQGILQTLERLANVYPEPFVAPYLWRLLDQSIKWRTNRDFELARRWSDLAVKLMRKSRKKQLVPDWEMRAVILVNAVSLLNPRRERARIIKLGTEAMDALVRLPRSHPCRDRFSQDLISLMKIAKSQKGIKS